MPWKWFPAGGRKSIGTRRRWRPSRRCRTMSSWPQRSRSTDPDSSQRPFVSGKEPPGPLRAAAGRGGGGSSEPRRRRRKEDRGRLGPLPPIGWGGCWGGVDGRRPPNLRDPPGERRRSPAAVSGCPRAPLEEAAEMEGAPPGPAGLSYAVAAVQILGLAVVTVVGAWMGHFRGGLAWDSPRLQFNVHPLCMTLGMVFLQGDALLVFRVFRNEGKRATKILHGLLHSLALVVALVGLVAVFQYHKKQAFPDLYSLHSWCGILAFSFYFLQWLVGLGFFLFPGASFSLRSRYKPQHAFLGAAIFLLSVATALLGILELLLFKIKDTYSSFAPEGLLANTLGLLLAAFGALLGYILTREEWRRPPRGEEMALSMDFKTLTEEEPGHRSPVDPR